MINYEYEVGDRVFVIPNGRYAEVTSRVPGNGTLPWYFVQYDDDRTEDRFTGRDLRRA